MPSWVDSKALRFVLVGLVVVMGTAYIISTTSSTASGYEMNKLEDRVASLQTDIQKTQIEIADYSSINSIQSRLATMKMVEAGGIKYLNASDITMAKK